MNESIHGHEVMEMMTELKQTFTNETLIEAINNKFGKNTKFHTCSAENMTAAELIEFLRKKEKFIQDADGFTTEPDKICNH